MSWLGGCEMDIVTVLDNLDDYSRTIKGVAGLISDMQLSDGAGAYIYSEERYVLLERVLFDVVQNMDRFYKEVEEQR